MLMRRMKRELELLRDGTAPGVAAWLVDESRMDRLEGELTGAEGTPYEGGVFRLDISVSTDYPMKPPAVRFVTKIYHPNIDTEGRICLDSLNMPPKGAWKPALNIATLLTTILALLSTPNPDDGLMPEISDLFRNDHQTFERTAREWTRRYAKPGASATPNESGQASTPTSGATKLSESTSTTSRSRLSRRKESSNNKDIVHSIPSSADAAQKGLEQEVNNTLRSTPMGKNLSPQQYESVNESSNSQRNGKSSESNSSPVRNRLSRRKSIEIESSPDSSPVRNRNTCGQPIIIDSSPEASPKRAKPSRRKPIEIDDSPESKRLSPPVASKKSKFIEKRNSSSVSSPPTKKKPEKSVLELVVLDSDEDEDANEAEKEKVVAKASSASNEDEDDDDLFTEPKSVQPPSPAAASPAKRTTRLKKRPMTPPIISDDDMEDEDDVDEVAVRRSSRKSPLIRERAASPSPPKTRSTPRRVGSRLKRRRR